MPLAEKLFAENTALKAELENLRAQLAWFQRQVFGARSEKLPADPAAQTTLGLTETTQAAPAKQTVTYERRTPAPEKRPMPAEVFAGLPVTETIEIIPDEVKAQPEAFEQIGQERTFDEARQREDGRAAGAAPERSAGVSGAGARNAGREANKWTSPCPNSPNGKSSARSLSAEPIAPPLH
jgi:Transposase C of IS166 homeodomain